MVPLTIRVWTFVYFKSQIEKWWEVVERKFGENWTEFTCRTSEGCQRYAPYISSGRFVSDFAFYSLFSRTVQFASLGASRKYAALWILHFFYVAATRLTVTSGRRKLFIMKEKAGRKFLSLRTLQISIPACLLGKVWKHTEKGRTNRIWCIASAIIYFLWQFDFGVLDIDSITLLTPIQSSRRVWFFRGFARFVWVQSSLICIGEAAGSPLSQIGFRQLRRNRRH